MRLRCGCVLLTLALAASAGRAQIVTGDVIAVGFPGGQQRGLVRTGQWFPIVLDLSVQGTQVFQGGLRVECVDLDGDRVDYTERQVTVTTEAGRKRAWCYAVINRLNEAPPTVDIIDGNGVLVNKLALGVFDVLPNDDVLVLDISANRVSALSGLVTPGWQPGAMTRGQRPFYRDVVVSPMEARNLPDRWWGLESVDVIVWDAPQPAFLSIAQLDALMEWVRNGGQLIVGVGASWDAISKSRLVDIMPLQGEGRTVESRRADVFFGESQGLVSAAVRKREFERPVAFTTAGLADDAVRTLGESSPDGTSIPLITMRSVGAGRVVATGATLRDLTSVPVNAGEFCNRLFDLNPLTEKFRQNEESTWHQSMQFDEPLYREITNPVAFRYESTFRGVAVFLFVVGYILLATLGSWAWLRRRQLTAQSWTVFAAFAVAGSGAGLLTVGALRGVVGRLDSVQVLDLQGGDRQAGAYCLFGYRSPIRQRIELTLPGPGNYLRPLSCGPGDYSSYVTPMRYIGLPARATLAETPLRATLKQFEGRWHGELGGTIRTNLTADRATGRITRESWIVNDLPIAFDDGYLLYIDPRLRDATGDVPHRVAGLTRTYAHNDSKKPSPPGLNVVALHLGGLPKGPGSRLDGLGATKYAEIDAANQKAKPDDQRDLPTLLQEQLGWAPGGGFRVEADVPAKRTWLASTRNLYLYCRDLKSPDDVGRPVTTDGLPDLDISDWLMRGQAVLLLWTSDPGPARLQQGGDVLKPARGFSVYRVRVPIDYAGRPPRPGSPP